MNSGFFNPSQQQYYLGDDLVYHEDQQAQASGTPTAYHHPLSQQQYPQVSSTPGQQTSHHMQYLHQLDAQKYTQKQLQGIPRDGGPWFHWQMDASPGSTQRDTSLSRQYNRNPTFSRLNPSLQQVYSPSGCVLCFHIETRADTNLNDIGNSRSLVRVSAGATTNGNGGSVASLISPQFYLPPASDRLQSTSIQNISIHCKFGDCREIISGKPSRMRKLYAFHFRDVHSDAASKSVSKENACLWEDCLCCISRRGRCSKQTHRAHPAHVADLLTHICQVHLKGKIQRRPDRK
jgi:hypothetical protein